jgi:hypothetical protein
MSDLSLVRLNLNTGLDGISYTRGNNNPSLPRDRDLQPSGVGRRPLLETLLEMPNLDSFLHDTLMPGLDHPQLLNRIQFERTLDGLHAGLYAVINKLGPVDTTSDDHGTDGEADSTAIDQRDLHQAGEALTRERTLRGEVWNYLNALHQG